MKNLFLLIGGFAFMCFISSCGVNRVYTSATYGSVKPYTEKPVFDKEKGEGTQNTYISANVSTGFTDQDDTQFIGSLDLYRSHAQKNINFYYGAGASFGNYKFGSSYSNSVKTNETKSMYSLNLKSGFNIAANTQDFEFRILGLEVLYNYEGGDYQDKISTIAVNDSTVVLAQKSMLSLNLYSEHVWKINPKSRITLGIFLGMFPLVDKAQNSEIKTNFGGINVGYNYDRYTFYYIRQQGQANIGSDKFGLAYRF